MSSMRMLYEYKFGFNGKENIEEIDGWQDYGARMYNRLIGRFPTADPLIVYQQQYPELSTYQFAGNTPIQAIDLDGLEPYPAYVNGSLVTSTGTIIKPSTSQQAEAQKSYGTSQATGTISGSSILLAPVAAAYGVLGNMLYATGNAAIEYGVTGDVDAVSVVINATPLKNGSTIKKVVVEGGKELTDATVDVTLKGKFTYLNGESENNKSYTAAIIDIGEAVVGNSLKHANVKTSSSSAEKVVGNLMMQLPLECTNQTVKRSFEK